MANASRLFRSLWRRPAAPTKTAPRKLALTRLEDRSVPSISVPLNAYVWTQIGPNPIAPAPDGQAPATPGNLTVGGRAISVISPTVPAGATPAQIDAAANTLLASTAGGGVWRSLDGGLNWSPRTDNQLSLTILDRANAPTTIFDRSLKMGAMASSPTNPNIVWAGEGNPGQSDEEFSPGGQYHTGYSDRNFAGRGLLKSIDGGTSWQMIKGPDVIDPFGGTTPAFEGTAVIKVVPHPTDPDVVFVITQGSTGVGDNLVYGDAKQSAVWRTLDGGLNWDDITQNLVAAVAAPPGPVDRFRMISDFTLDPSNPNIAYVAVADPNLYTPGNAYELNGVYRTTTVMSDDLLNQPINYVVVFGGNGSFVPGTTLGSIRVETAPSNPSTVYVAVARPSTPAGGIFFDLFKSLESGVNFRQLNTVPNFIEGQDGGNAAYNMAMLIDPANENRLILAGRGKYTGGANPTTIIISQDGGLTWENISTDGSGRGPFQIVRNLSWDAKGRLLAATDGGAYRYTFGGSGGAGGTWDSLNGNPGPTGLGAIEVTAVGLPTTTVDQFIASTYGAGTVRFDDSGDPVTGPISPSDPRYPGLFSQPVVDSTAYSGNIQYDFVNQNIVYRTTSRLNPGANGANIVQRSNDGGQTWAPVGGTVPNFQRSFDVPAFELDPSFQRRLFFGTDVLNISEDGGQTWGRGISLQGTTGLVNIPNLPLVTDYPASFGVPGIPITAIGVGRFDFRVAYVAVQNRARRVQNGDEVYGPAIYRIDTNFNANGEPFWRDVSPDRLYWVPPSEQTPPANPFYDDPQPGWPLPGHSPIPQGFQVPGWGMLNSLTGEVLDIAVDPNDSNIVLVTVDTDLPVGRVWRTTDGGDTWLDITGNLGIEGGDPTDPNLLPATDNLRGYTVVIDPNQLSGSTDDDYYVGTSNGVWKLSDPTGVAGTQMWVRVGGYNNMPDVQVRDLKINTTTGVLAAATFGRGVWEFQIRPLVSGSVFEDLNGNGIRDTGEPPRANVLVEAFNLNENARNATTVTRSNGFYEFRSLRNGNYQVRVPGGVAAGEYQTTRAVPQPTAVTQFTTIPGNVGPGGSSVITPPADIGSFRLTSISGVLFDDLDGDGLRDANEPPKAGVVVRLRARDENGAIVTAINPATGAAVPDATTDANGAYSFTGLAPFQAKASPVAPPPYRVNPYVVQEVLPAGTVRSSPAVADILLTSGVPYTTNAKAGISTDIGLFTMVTIQGTVFDDTNGDGIRQGEPRLGGVTVSLLTHGPDGKIGTVDDVVLDTRVSDPNGGYAFVNLGPGTYYVREEISTLPAGYRLTSSNPRGPIVPQSGQGLASPPRDPSVPAAFGPFDFGNFRDAGLSGTVFEDDNGDGRRQPNETRPIVGATVVLIDPGPDGVTGTPAKDADNAVLSTATTDAAGFYQFTGLQPLAAGNARPYMARVVQPSSLFVQTSADAKAQLTSGIVTGGLNLGYFRRTTISGFAFEDINGNGVQDAGEPAASNFPVSLLNSDNPAQVVGVATTDATGQYRFAYNPANPNGFSGGPLQLNADTQGPGGAVIAYRIAVNLPDVVQTNAPGDLVLTSGVPAAGPTLALFRTVGFGGVVYDDTNGDGGRNAGEPGVGGVTVELVTASGAVAINQATGQPISTITAANGSYNLRAPNGTFTVRLNNLPAGTIATTASPALVTTFSGQVLPPIDLGTFRTFPVSGLVYDDVNGNGARDAGEPGLGNILVRLLTATGATTAFATTTDASGAYTLAGVGPIAGGYRLTPTLPPGVFFVSPAGPVNLTATSGLVLPNATTPTTFGVFRAALISGHVFEDLNRSGTLNPGEGGSVGWTVQVLNTAGQVIASGVSDAAGNYAISGVPAGAAVVRLADRSGWLQTLSPVPLGSVVTSGGAAVASQLGGLRLGSVAGTVFNDANRNGRLDNNETGLVGVTVELVQNGNVVASMASGASGAFQFRGIAGGAYTLRLNSGTISSGRVQTGPQTNGLTYPLVITEGNGTAGNAYTSQDFGVAGRKRYAVAADGGGGPRVQTYDATSGALVSDQFVYETSFTGGVRVASGDVNGDGVDDLITVAGKGGGPRVRALDGITGATLYDYYAYEPSFRLGLYAAVADVNGDGFADIITGTDAGGGPRVTVFSGRDGRQLLDFFAFDPEFRGGVRIGAGDVDGDGRAEVIAAGGPGLGAEVRVFDSTGRRISTFNPVDSAFTGGLFVAGGATDPSTGRASVLVGTGAGYADQGYAFVFNGQTGDQLFQLEAFPQGPTDTTTYKGDVRVASFDTTGDSVPEIIIASGAGVRSQVRVLDGLNRREISTLNPFEPQFLGGLFIG